MIFNLWKKVGSVYSSKDKRIRNIPPWVEKRYKEVRYKSGVPYGKTFQFKGSHFMWKVKVHEPVIMGQEPRTYYRRRI